MNNLRGWNGIRALVFTLILASGLASISPVFAQSWKINSGRNVGTLLPMETRKLADGGTYLTGGSKVLVETEDSTYPINGHSMDCRWICKIPANGKDGACITMCGGVDNDGDLFSFRAIGFGGGNYEVGAGTGKYAKASGGGTFEVLPVADPALTQTRWKGMLQLR